MSSHYYHYLNCSICQTSNCCICQQLEEHIELLDYMQFQHFIQIQYLQDLLQQSQTSETEIQEQLNLERHFHQFYAQERVNIENNLRDHKLHNIWHRYD